MEILYILLGKDRKKTGVGIYIWIISQLQHLLWKWQEQWRLQLPEQWWE